MAGALCSELRYIVPDKLSHYDTIGNKANVRASSDDEGFDCRHRAFFPTLNSSASRFSNFTRLERRGSAKRDSMVTMLMDINIEGSAAIDNGTATVRDSETTIPREYAYPWRRASATNPRTSSAVILY